MKRIVDKELWDKVWNSPTKEVIERLNNCRIWEVEMMWRYSTGESIHSLSDRFDLNTGALYERIKRINSQLK